MSLQGKTLFVTGASRGIGLAIALRAARDGANVAIAAKTAEAHKHLPGTIYSAAEEIEKAKAPETLLAPALPPCCGARPVCSRADTDMSSRPVLALTPLKTLSKRDVDETRLERRESRRWLMRPPRAGTPPRCILRYGKPKVSPQP